MAEINKNISDLQESEKLTYERSPDSSTDAGLIISEQPKPSITGVIKNAVRVPLHHKEKKETSPALQEAIDQMEARKAAAIAKMEAEGKDTSVLSSKPKDVAKNAAWGSFEGFPQW